MFARSCGQLASGDEVVYVTATALYSLRANGTLVLEHAYDGEYANGLAVAVGGLAEPPSRRGDAEATLYVAVSFPRPRIDAFAVLASGALVGRRSLVQASPVNHPTPEARLDLN